MKRALLVALCGLALASTALAYDANPPWWRGLEGTSTAVWDYWYGPGYDGVDYFTSNPPGLASPTAYHESGWNWWGDSWYGYDRGWRLPWTSRYKRLAFDLDNFDQGNPRKDIRVQVTFWTGYDQYTWLDPWYLRVWAWSDESWQSPMPTGSWYDLYPVTTYYHSGSQYGWWTATFDLSLFPNPDSEIVGLDFGYLPYDWWWYDSLYPTGPRYMWIDQVVIDTRCVPEPGTLAVMLLGMAAALWRRR